MSSNSPYDPSYWPASHAILLTVGGILSLTGSYVIIREVIEDMKQRRGKSVNRMLMALSISDITWSASFIISTYAMPSTIDFVWGNVGTLQTCEFQGFLFGLGSASSACFSAMLSTFYLLSIRYTWTDQQLHKLEPYIYSCVVTIALVFAIVPILYQQFNPSKFGICFFSPYPLGCYHDEETVCIRGEKSKQVSSIYTVYLWVWIVTVIVNMIRIFATVRAMENRNARYATNATAPNASHSNFVVEKSRTSAAAGSAATAAAATTATSDDNNCGNGNNHNGNDKDNGNPEPFLDDVAQTSSFANRRKSQALVDRRKSRSVGVQGIYYSLVFLGLYTPPTVRQIVLIVTGYSNTKFTLFGMFCLSLQGFWNCLIFIRNRNMKTREGKLFRNLFCCLKAKQLVVDAKSTLSHNHAGESARNEAGLSTLSSTPVSTT